MNEIYLEEILDFRNVISILNRELKSKKIFDLEYMLINNSISDVMKVLEANSYYYSLIKDDRYSNGATFSELMEIYFQYVKSKYESLLILDGKNDRIADKYYDKLKEPTKRNNIFLQYPKSSIGMIQQDVEKTLKLMREAILAYYKVYHNKKLVAELTTNNIKDSDYLEFMIKEEELLHLLGVTAKQLRNNPDFIRLTGNSHMDSVEILEWIVRDSEGNNDLMQYSEDFIKRISKDNFVLSKLQFDQYTQSRLLNYHKVRTKSQAFLKYGPFEKVSLVAKIQQGKSLAVHSKSNTAMISRAECFKKYPWAYFGSVQNPSNRYIETLIIDSAEGKKELFRGSTPAIVKGVYSMVEGEGGSPGIGAGSHIFSEEEQFNLFCLAYESFKDQMDFKNLKDYFADFLHQNKGKEKNIMEEMASQIINLDINSLESLYNDVIELSCTVDEINYNNSDLKNIYLKEISNKIKYLSPEQIAEIKSRISDNKYTRKRK